MDESKCSVSNCSLFKQMQARTSHYEKSERSFFGVSKILIVDDVDVSEFGKWYFQVSYFNCNLTYRALQEIIYIYIHLLIYTTF